MAYREWGDPDNDRVLVCVPGLMRVSNDFDALASALESDDSVVFTDFGRRGRSRWVRDPNLNPGPPYVDRRVPLPPRHRARTFHVPAPPMHCRTGV